MAKNWQKYVNLTRINRPTGIFLLALPCFFGVFFAFSGKIGQNWDKIGQFCLFFALGSIIMRSAGCVVNDIFDQKFDREVARTKSRPLANGDLKTSQALILLAVLLIFGLMILLQFSPKTIIGGVLALILVVFYPLMKRITFYPQIFLGVVFNFGILLASLEIKGQIDFATIALYGAAIIWTLIYDTIYAFQDIEDDMKIGVKSSAIALGKNPKRSLSYLVIFLGFLLFLAGFLHKMADSYYFFAILPIFYLLCLIKKCDFKNPQNCLQVFKKNTVVGALILLAIAFG